MQRVFLQHRLATLIILCVLSSLLALSARATVLLQLGFEQLVAQSEFIFTGTVVDSRTQVQGEQLYTLVSFDITEVVKGVATGTTLELSFLGGNTESAGLQVEGQFIPTLGTRGVFFVSTLTERQVNPLTGWQQGYFPLAADDSGDDYLDMRQRRDLPIPGLEVQPLVSKMRGMGFSEEAIDAKFPRAFLFSWDDFRTAIVDEISSGGTAP